MKKILLGFLMITAFMSCEKEVLEPSYSIEGKWLWSPSENRVDANTMYEFKDGNVYKSYCIVCPANDDYWNSLDSTDRIPGVDTYTLSGDTLVWDGISFGITFECDGGELLFTNGNKLWRLSSNCQ